eukprot:GHVN01095917.1.p2 GENE.GHVN01095917.1~~GHVN01095917.1.p2  ORF type:complete len:104 (-),score=1.36 GHVN01095917.1:470-781(-)
MILTFWMEVLSPKRHRAAPVETVQDWLSIFGAALDLPPSKDVDLDPGSLSLSIPSKRSKVSCERAECDGSNFALRECCFAVRWSQTAVYATTYNTFSISKTFT